ncbi:hypothetical protein BaRGS_00036750 [Batillaria attramentaria]|uniref:Right handed beta helix domain-containing protein n=1 Tax=Batillaria attramentaria TaxID=370345 RepID=A0ABD0JAV0_9CAEN
MVVCVKLMMQSQCHQPGLLSQCRPVFPLSLRAGVAGRRAATVHLYVSPTGSDSNGGRQVSHPVKTLQHALNMLESDGFRGNNVFVELMAGYHYMTSTLRFHVPHNGTVGGQPIPSSLFHHVTDTHVLQRLPLEARGKVLELDLTGAGIQDLGTLTTYGFYHLWKAPLEIFINGRPLKLAQWPNDGFINIKCLPDGEHGRRFTYDSGNRDSCWAQETAPWAYGWWHRSWADSSLPVSSVDPHTHTITLAKDSQYGLRVGHYTPTGPQVGNALQGGYFRVINMLCEIDQPGEYYIDRTTKKLYVWPNTPHQTLTSSDVVYGSMLPQCLKIEKRFTDLHFEDFTIEGCRQFGVDANSVSGLTFSNMEFKNTGSFGIHCTGDCRRVSVLASEFHDVGGGMYIAGGDRTTLTSSEIVVRDNHLWEFSRCGAFPGDAIHVAGVGARVEHNHVHHGQYSGIRWNGNDHVIEYNHVHHMCWNASDCGALHTGRQWTWRGNVVRYNYIHHTLRYMPGADVRGIMLDDEYSSALIEHNVFFDNEVHVNIGGGRDNVIRYNVMYNATKYSIQVDARGMGSDPAHNHIASLTQTLEASPYKTPLWQSRYPELANILSKHPEAPEGNQIYENVFYNTVDKERIHYSSGTRTVRKDYFDVHHNLRAYKTTDFWSPDDADFRFRCEAAQWASSHHVPQPVTLDQTVSSRAPVPCDSPTTTVAPASTVPQTSYMPDGSSPNTLYPNIPKGGNAEALPRYFASALNGTYKENTGTQAGTEEGCLSRAAQEWKWCGSPSNGRVIAIYGTTGAMTFATEGCYFAEYGCHGSDNPGFHRDIYAEKHQNGSTDEEGCLKRAHAQWPYCGSDPTRPYTSIFGPTGHFRTAGAGCWIKLQSCPAHRNLEGFFYDAWGATNLGTDHDKMECFDRAEYFWTRCGSQADAPVTAFYRPAAANHTVP